MTSVFRDPRWVRRDLLGVLGFYYPTAVDTRFGGYVSQVSDRDGAVYDARTKHLVPTCRFVFDFSVGALVDGPDWCRTAAEHGLSFLANVVRDADGGGDGGDDGDGYPWVLEGRSVADDRRSTYGHAFVLLAYATAARADIGDAADWIEPTADLLDEHYWEPAHGAYRSDLGADWEPIESYRGQNANMHACEALLAAYEATGEDRYLDRAAMVADTVARRLADAADSLIWEHFTTDWDVDWDYNRDAKSDLFRPWGYQPGHLLEWAKLLVVLDALDGPDGAGWYLDRAERFFDAAVEHGWDDDRGGFVYTFDRDGDPIVTDRYFWPPAEGVAAAAHLAEATGDDRYWDWYDRIWSYVDETLTNHRYGIWYETVTPDGEPTNLDPSPKVKSGYHHVNACYEVMRALGAA